jgi:hypothetical protein
MQGDANRAGLPRAAKPSDWEEYARRFAEKYKFTKEQSEQAFRLLRGCEEEAANYRSKRSSEFEAIERDIAKLGAPSDDAAKNEGRQLQERLDRLRGPIDEIFEKRLKPGLEKLPTRAQRRAVDESDAPSSKP